MFPYFDLHCDTLVAAYDKSSNIYNDKLYASISKLKHASPYIQIASIWSDYRLSSNEAFSKALNVISFAKNQNIEITTNLNHSISQAYILGIEDARILEYDLSRIDTLYSLGIRVITLNWKDASCIGGGWNTEIGLTDFGKEVIKKCASLGIIVDLSHSSSQVFYDTLALSDKLAFVPIASHSNSFSICSHKRNLTDFQLKSLFDIKSIVGISLVGEHLGQNPTINTIISHIEHIFRLGGERCLCLGCDLDGTDSLPIGISSVEDIYKLYDIICDYFGNNLAKRIFFHNAYDFFKAKLK